MRMAEQHDVARRERKIGEQDSTGTGERGLPLGTRGAAVFARDKVVLLGCLPLSPPSLVRQRSMILGGLRGCSA